MARRNRNEVPGSPQVRSTIPEETSRRPLHPAALLIACLAVGVGLAWSRSAIALALAATVAAGLALRAEGRSLRGEAPALTLALLVFLAHTFLSGRPPRDAAYPASLIALRLLALLYLLRWAARAFLGAAARWLFTLPIPGRPRALLLGLESGRHAMAMTPLALREAAQQHDALRARGIRPAGGLRGRARYVAAWLLPFLGTMLRVGESYGEALACRGYVLGAPRGRGRVLGWGAPELGILFGGVAVAAWLLLAP